MNRFSPTTSSAFNIDTWLDLNAATQNNSALPQLNPEFATRNKDVIQSYAKYRESYLFQMVLVSNLVKWLRLFHFMFVQT